MKRLILIVSMALGAYGAWSDAYAPRPEFFDEVDFFVDFTPTLAARLELFCHDLAAHDYYRIYAAFDPWYVHEQMSLAGDSAPDAEIVRYCMELTPLRVIAWWVWVLALLAIARRIRAAGLDATVVMSGAAVAFFSAVVLVQSVRMMTTIALTGATTELGNEVALPAAAFALTGLCAAAALVWRALARRGAPR